MKKILFIALILFSKMTCYGQSAQAMLDEIEGKWLPDENGEVTISKIVGIDSLDKDQLFEKAAVYFNTHFINGKSFIDTKDKGTGLLVAKGTFIANQQENKSPVLTPLYALYIVRVDVVDKRAKLSVSLTGYDSSRVSNLKENFFPEMPIEREYPVNIHGLYKNYMAKAFYRSFKMANEIVNELEQFLISTPKNKVNW